MASPPYPTITPPREDNKGTFVYGSSAFSFDDLNQEDTLATKHSASSSVDGCRGSDQEADYEGLSAPENWKQEAELAKQNRKDKKSGNMAGKGCEGAGEEDKRYKKKDVTTKKRDGEANKELEERGETNRQIATNFGSNENTAGS
ncbi:hypothetical protein TWF718_000149 [Orbilia javanica]|uniref:Uncharacterized protein n=1 Tax=Orbilia javanica TaxID=47235 RepID=A0AAN8RLU6_9PEZI